MESVEQILKLTSVEIEELLQQEEYSPVPRLDKRGLSAEDKQEVYRLERRVSFSNELLDLFDYMVRDKGTLPTQAEYIEQGLPFMLHYLEHEAVEKMPITDLVRAICSLRLGRTYMSKVIEVHLYKTVKELLPHLKIYSHPLLDTIGGVDYIVEDEAKRYYTHITSNTPFASKMLLHKEKRGGYQIKDTFIKYNRDFTGDLILKYDVTGNTETTINVNGFPLFRAEYLADRFDLAFIQKSVGEPLTTEYSKLQTFKDWARTMLNVKVTVK